MSKFTIDGSGSINDSHVTDAVFKIEGMLEDSMFARERTHRRENDHRTCIQYKEEKPGYETQGLVNRFIVEILYCQNNSWQGYITWRNHSEEQKRKSFRSVLELLKLINSSFTEAEKCLWVS